MSVHEEYMKIAIEEANRGIGHVSPNPLVGAVIVKDGRIIGRGAHLHYGKNHAEVNAIESCKESCKGAVMYVTLEPCDHYGNTPPCSLRIIEEGIAEVYIAAIDKSSRVNGRGIKRLQDAGVVVETGILEDEAIEQNQFFFHYAKYGTPFVLLKSAISLDGCIGTRSGDSKWISGKESRQFVHHLRSVYDAVLVGKNTAKNDNPRLNVRMVEGRDPLRIVVDRSLSLDISLNLFSDENAHLTVVFTSQGCDLQKKVELEQKNVRIIESPVDKDGYITPAFILEKLGEMGIVSLLVEGGSFIASMFMEADCVDRLNLFIAPIIIGSGKTFLSLSGVESIKDSYSLDDVSVSRSGVDIFLDGMVRKKIS